MQEVTNEKNTILNEVTMAVSCHAILHVRTNETQ